MDIATLDVETSDPNLKSLGCGAVRGDGRILTVAIYCPAWGIDGYWTWDDFLQDEEAIALLEDESVCKVMHNGLYDLNWLCIWGGLTVNNTDDTLTRETLLDAYSYSYALQTCCDKHGVAGKNREDTIDAWWARKGHSTKAIEHLAEIPVDIVGKYNLQDVHATYELYMVQQPLLEEQNLLQCNDVERSLIPWLLKTRKQGMRIDNKALRELTKIVVDRYTKSCFTWEMKYGNVNPASNKQLQELFTSLGLEIPISAKTQRPSFDADSLEDVEHPCAAQIVELKGLKKLLGTYLEGQFINFQYKGHINGELHPAKSDEGGTVTGRFSCSNPNMQNISAREEKYGNEVRSLFIPEDGCLLGAFDYKQIEYRVFTHFAIMCGAPGADEAEKQFKKDPDTDYHLMGQKLMGWYFPADEHKTKQYRHIMKNLGFTCRSTDSYFATRRGYIKATCLLDEDRLTMDSGEWRAFIGRKKQYRMLLSNGQEHKITHDHPFRFFGKKVGASELKVGDPWEVVPCTCFGDYQTEHVTVNYHHVPRTREFRIDEDFAYIIGLWLGDSSLHTQCKTKLPQALSFTTDSEHTDYVVNLIGLRPTFGTRTERSDTWYVSDKFLATWFNDNCGKTKNKHVPDVIYRSPRSVIISLLKGFLDSDGTVHNGKPQLVNTNEALIRQLARCIAMVGWEARCTSEKYNTVTPQGKEYSGTLYRLILHRTPQLFTEFQGVLRTWEEPQEYHSTKDPVTIVSIEDIGEQDTMCISLPDPHWYEAECCINHNSLYGLGPKSFAHKFRKPLMMAHPDYTGSLQTLAKYLQDMYYTKVPFIKYTCKKIEQTAERRSYIKTVSGRRNRFRKDRGAYVMTNYLVQGSAGDIIKKAIVDSWKAGVWDVLIPHNMVHDELVFSIPDTKEGYEACIKLRECMRNAYQLRVPIGVDTEIGPDWGHCNEENWEAFEKKWAGSNISIVKKEIH